MSSRLLKLVLLAGLGFGVLMALPISAADSPDAAKIKQLIEKLGSGKFDEREQATKDLDALGAPALEALRAATKSDDAEVSRRSSDLVKSIEKRTESKTVLKPTTVHLVFKDTPLIEAVAEFHKKTGYPIVVHDPENKLKGRTITLDTGETTFWKALDLFCEKAGVHEATQQELVVQPILRPNPLPPEHIKPLPPIRPLQPQPLENNSSEKPAGFAAEEPAARPAAPPVAAPPVAAPALLIRRIQPRLPQQNGQITLIDGKPETQPTDYASAVRVRALTNVVNIFGNAEEGTILLGLQVTPEPKITWQNLVAVKIEKALDDKDQQLTEAMAPNGPGGIVPFQGKAGGGIRPMIAIARPPVWNGGFMGNLNQMVPVHLKKGEKASKLLKELTGTITAEVLAEPKTLITTDEILKSAGKTYKGDEGGSITVVSVDKDANGLVKVVFELEQPAGFIVPNNMGIIQGGGAFPLPVPVPPGRILPLPQQNAGFQAQAVPIQVAPGGQIQIQVVGGVQIGGAVMQPVNGGANGLKLVDEKGNPVAGAGIGMQFKQPAAGGRFTPEYVLTVQLKKEQTEAGKLTFSASKSVTVDIPFTLKDIVLP